MSISRSEFLRQPRDHAPFLFLPPIIPPLRPIIRGVINDVFQFLRRNQNYAFTSSEIYNYISRRRFDPFLPLNIDLALHHLAVDDEIRVARHLPTGLRYYIFW